MIEIKGKYLTYWFRDSVRIIDAFRLANYRQCKDTNTKIGFIKRISYTKTLNLLNLNGNLLNFFSKKTIYEVKKAKTEGVNVVSNINYSEFINFYNENRRKSGLNTLNVKAFNNSLNYLYASKSVYENNTLVAHLYLIDSNSKRARLLYSVSDSSTGDGNLKKIIGYSNRLLHFSDIEYFVEKGFHLYDIGGYALNTDNDKLKNINKFKSEFANDLVCEGNYMSYPFYFIQKLIAQLKK